MSAYSWPASRQTVIDLNGAVVPGALLNFYNSGTMTPLVAYSDSALSVPLPNTIEADAYGRWPRVYLPYVDYRERARTSGGVLLWDDDGIANPPPATSGGGGSIPDSQLLRTGSHKWLMQDAEEVGWVRANARTIGNAGSGATERANDDTEDLFIWVYNRSTNAMCPVSGGRGANAEADFAAGKTIQMPDMRGVSPFGLDTMGNSAASRFASVTIDIGSATVAGSSGGRNSTTIAQANLPAVSPVITVNDTSQKSISKTTTNLPAGTGSPQQVVTDVVTAGGATTVQTTTTTTGSVTASIAALGSGTPASTMSRFMPGTHYLKL